MWSRHLKYLRSYSLINDPLLPSPIFVPCIYGSGFRSLVHCHKALAFCHIRHWLGAPEEHLSKDNTSVSMPYHQFLLGAQPNFDWTKHYSHTVTEMLALVKESEKVQSPDWLCRLSGFIPFIPAIWSSSVTQQQPVAGFLWKLLRRQLSAVASRGVRYAKS